MLIVNKAFSLNADHLTTFNFILNFLIGILLYKNLDFFNIFYKRINRYVLLIIFFISVILFTYATGILNILGMPDIFKRISFYTLTSLASAVFIIFSINSTLFSKLLLLKPLQFMGKISYSLYLVHAIVLFSLIYLLHGLIENYQIALVGFVISILVATIFYTYIERYSIELSKGVTR